MFCKNCGQQLEDDQKFCHKCGSPVEDAAETTETLSPEKVVVESTDEVDASPSEPVIAQSPEGYAVSDDSQAGEIYYTPKWIKITILCIACFCLLMAILTFKTPLEFNWFFGSCSYSLGFGLLTIVALAFFAGQFGEHRHTRNYLTSEGKLDISTPRSYTALEKPWLLRALDTDNYYGFADTLESFDYADGQIAITTRKGQMIEAPLSELTWKYSMTKPKDADGWHIYKYTLTDQSGHTIKFYRAMTIEDEEWDDVNMLLSLSGEVKEGKTSKIARKLHRVLDSVKDADFSDIAGSAVGVGVNETSNHVIDMVKAKYITKTETKGGLWNIIKNVFNYLLWIILAIYALTVIFVNVVDLISYLSSDDNRDDIETLAGYNEYDSDEFADYSDDQTYSGGSVNESSTNESWVVEFEGKIGKYPIKMYLDLKNKDNYDYCPVEGSYCYTASGSGAYIYLSGVKRGERMELTEYNDNGEVTGRFEGTLQIFGRLASMEYTGTFTNYQGKTFSFSLRYN